jgi:hypothetical protein
MWFCCLKEINKHYNKIIFIIVFWYKHRLFTIYIIYLKNLLGGHRPRWTPLALGQTFFFDRPVGQTLKYEVTTISRASHCNIISLGVLFGRLSQGISIWVHAEWLFRFVQIWKHRWFHWEETTSCMWSLLE